MKTQEDVLQDLSNTFIDFYPPKVNETYEYEEFDTLEDFRDKWIEMIREIYHKKMNVTVASNIYDGLLVYSEYITNNGMMVSEERAIEKVKYNYEQIHKLIGNDVKGGCLCPYWHFGGSGKGYKMIRIPDKWTKTTVWCIAFEDVDNETRVVRGVELESVLASTDKIVYPPYQMRLPMDEQRLRRIIRQVIREHLCA